MPTFDLPEYVVEIQLEQFGRWQPRWVCTLYAYGDVPCKQCDSEGAVDGEKCLVCNGAGVVRGAIDEPPALTRAKMDSLEAQYLALYKRYGRLDVVSIRDYWEAKA